MDWKEMKGQACKQCVAGRETNRVGEGLKKKKKKNTGPAMIPSGGRWLNSLYSVMRRLMAILLPPIILINVFVFFYCMRAIVRMCFSCGKTALEGFFDPKLRVALKFYFIFCFFFSFTRRTFFFFFFIDFPCCSFWLFSV
jgi:hypothetical protein